MTKQTVERLRHLREIEGIDEQACVSDLPAAAAAHPAPKLILSGFSLPRGLLLQGAEGSKVSVSVSDLLHSGSTKSANQLVFQICDAHVETQPFHAGAGEVGAEAGSLETAPEVCFLSRVAEACQPDVEPVRAEVIQEPSDGLRASDRHDRNALGVEIPTAPHGKRFERALVTDPFDEHDRTRVDVGGRRRLVDVHQLRSLLLVHIAHLHSGHERHWLD